ncbi:MAG: hypothetical protein AAGA65_15600 [Actinomycetota bacterium]
MSPEQLDQFLGCATCGASPTGRFTFTEQVGAFITVLREEVGGRLCRDCAVATGRGVQNKSIAFGWFGLIAFFSNFMTLGRNARTLRRAARHEPPAPRNTRTLDPGRPVLFRFGVLVPLLVVGFVGYVIVDARLNPRRDLSEITVGQCIDAPGFGDTFDQLTIRPCAEPHEMEVFATSPVGDGLRPDNAKLDFCIQEFESYVGAHWFESDLDLTYFAPESRAADANEPVICALMAFDGTRLSGTMRGTGG